MEGSRDKAAKSELGGSQLGSLQAPKNCQDLPPGLTPDDSEAPVNTVSLSGVAIGMYSSRFMCAEAREG